MIKEFTLNRNRNLTLTVLFAAAVFLAGCTSTKEVIETSDPVQDAAEAQALIVGTWIENPNRDGNIEKGIWNADGTFYAEVTTRQGELVEIDGGTYCFENGLLKLTITELGGTWNGGKLEPFGSTVVIYYTYYVTEDSLHLERIKRVTDGNAETFNPPLADNYEKANRTPVTPKYPPQDAAEAQALIAGTWTEVNRDGNVETVTWGTDGSFQGAVITPDGDFVEVDNGWYEFMEGQLVLFIANAGGDWNGGVLEPIDPPLENWYSYYVTKNTLHLERTKWVRFGAEQSFDPPPTDDYTRK